MTYAQTVTDEQGYNGWRNYPTWNVALWIDNDEGAYHYARELARTAADEHERREGYGVNARGSLAHYLKEWVTDEILPDLGGTMAADLLGWAVEHVEWFDLADNYLEQIEDE